MTIYLTLQDLKRLIMDLESVANDTLTPIKNYPMTASISVGATNQETIKQDLEDAIISFIKEADPNKKLKTK